ncbi:MAG: DUF5675 family protein [Salinibacter sp.]
MKLILTRYFESEVWARGQLRLVEDGETIFSCYTLELPWKDNENQVSCIPTGEYTVRHRGATQSGSYDYDHFILRDVEGRSYILIHAGNLYAHTLECILVGDRYIDINDDGYPDMTGSRGDPAGAAGPLGADDGHGGAGRRGGGGPVLAVRPGRLRYAQAVKREKSRGKLGRAKRPWKGSAAKVGGGQGYWPGKPRRPSTPGGGSTGRDAKAGPPCGPRARVPRGFGG